MSTEQDLDELLQAASKIRVITEEVKRLREIEDWAMTQLPFREGDRVTLVGPITATHGWYTDREHLVPGATGICHRTYMFRGEWCFYYEPDVEWQVSEGFGRRYGPDKHQFMLRMRQARAWMSGDKGLSLPQDAQPWRAAYLQK